ncbi:MAG: HD domain-containing protein [Coriobacteriia bacterium]|nr:HD domain-containing protein [Coriobacteriia bacterium]
MKGQYIASLAEGTRVDEVFVIRSRDLRAARTGDAYLAMEFGDRTGVIPGVMFRPGPDDWSLPCGSVARVRGTVTSYRGVRRISVESMRAVSSYDTDDMIAAGTRERVELDSALRTLLNGVKSRGLRAVLRCVFGDKAFMERFRACPGSGSHHHAYMGGLLEHTVSVASLCRSLAPRYDGLDVDLLVAAALLHDIGMTEELRWDTTIERTDAGRLLGHVILGGRLVSQAIDRVGQSLDPGTGTRLLHVLISHHGEFESGAPVRPALLEAVILHHADDLDAQAAGFMAAVATAGVIEEPWSDAANLFGRPLYVPSALGPAPGPPVGAAVA